MKFEYVTQHVIHAYAGPGYAQRADVVVENIGKQEWRVTLTDGSDGMISGRDSSKAAALERGRDMLNQWVKERSN